MSGNIQVRDAKLNSIFVRGNDINANTNAVFNGDLYVRGNLRLAGHVFGKRRVSFVSDMSRRPLKATVPTVTQTGTIVTTVVLNEPIGRITTVSVNISVSHNQSFTLTNSFITTNSIIHASARCTTSTEKPVHVFAIPSNGSANIRIWPLKFSLSSDTVEITFTVVQSAYNSDPLFEVAGTNADTGTIALNANGGALLTTAGAYNDQMIMQRSATTTAGIITFNFGTGDQVEWECLIEIPTITSVLVWAGLKLTSTPTIATDADQVFFRFSTDDSNSRWHAVYSIGGTDTNLPTSERNNRIFPTVAAGRIYRLRINIDSDRIARMYIEDFTNGNEHRPQKHLVATTTALTNSVNLLPFIGVQTLTGSARSLRVIHQSISGLPV